MASEVTPTLADHTLAEAIVSGVRGHRVTLYKGHSAACAAAAHRIAHEAPLLARNAELEAENKMLLERGARAVIAYHAAICSPKGVVPDDEFYDAAIADAIHAEMDKARAALATKDTSHDA